MIPAHGPLAGYQVTGNWGVTQPEDAPASPVFKSHHQIYPSDICLVQTIVRSFMVLLFVV